MGQPVTITPDTAPQQSQGPVTITPDQQGPPSGFLSGLYDSAAAPVKAFYHSFVDKPTNGTLIDQSIDAQKAEGAKAIDNAKQGRYSEAAGHGLAAVVPGFGPAAAKAGEDIGSGNTGYGLGEASGLIAQAMAPSAAEEVPAGRIARTIGKAGAGVIDDIPVVRQMGKVRDYWNETAPKTPSPDPMLEKARALFEGSSSPADPAAGLGKIPVAPGQAGQIASSVQKPAQVAPNFSRGNLGKLLDESLGAKKLEPNVPIGKQLDVKPPQAGGEDLTPILQKSLDQVKGADLPEGHTAHDSSALRSSMYDSGANEFHARMTSSGNTTYVFGDVSPEEADAFNNAESKGKAFQQIKNGHPLVAKIVNGKRIAVKAPNASSGAISEAMTQ